MLPEDDTRWVTEVRLRAGNPDRAASLSLLITPAHPMTTALERTPHDHHPGTPDDWTDTVEPERAEADTNGPVLRDDCCSQAVKDARTDEWVQIARNRPVPPR